MTLNESRESKKLKNPSWVFLVFLLIVLIIGLGLICFIFYKCMKTVRLSFKLARNRGKAMEPTTYKAVTVDTGNKDDVTNRGAISIQLVESVTLTSIKLQQGQEIEARPTIHVLNGQYSWSNKMLK